MYNLQLVMMKKYVLAVFFVMTMSFSLGALSETGAGEGEAIYQALGCWSCHGKDGHSEDDNYPSLAGRSSDWIVQQLEAFQSGERENPMMSAMAPMAEGFERVIADYLSSLKL